MDYQACNSKTAQLQSTAKSRVKRTVQAANSTCWLGMLLLVEPSMFSLNAAGVMHGNSPHRHTAAHQYLPAVLAACCEVDCRLSPLTCMASNYRCEICRSCHMPLQLRTADLKLIVTPCFQSLVAPGGTTQGVSSVMLLHQFALAWLHKHTRVVQGSGRIYLSPLCHGGSQTKQTKSLSRALSNAYTSG